MPGPAKPITKFLPKGLDIIYEDRAILVVDKPAGLLTMATDTEKTRTAFFALTDYVRKGAAKSKNRIFIVHRLDRDTSGILVFAKTEEAQANLLSQWPETRKVYLAVVHGRCENQEETITSYLAESKSYDVYSTSEPGKGKLAYTAYKVLKETKFFSLLEVALLTSRKHQIRVHLADAGHPVVGDKRYGREDKGHKRLALHALSISLRHPVSDKELTFSTAVPTYFNKFIGSSEGLVINPPVS